MPPAALPSERSAGRCAGRIRCARQRASETERTRCARSEFSLGPSADKKIRTRVSLIRAGEERGTRRERRKKKKGEGKFAACWRCSRRRWALRWRVCLRNLGRCNVTASGLPVHALSSWARATASSGVQSRHRSHLQLRQRFLPGPPQDESRRIRKYRFASRLRTSRLTSGPQPKPHVQPQRHASSSGKRRATPARANKRTSVRKWI